MPRVLPNMPSVGKAALLLVGVSVMSTAESETMSGKIAVRANTPLGP